MSLDALNYLAKRLDGMDELERKQFFAALTCDEVNIGYGLKNIINLTFNLDRFTLIRDTSDLRMVGRTHMLNIRGGIATSELERKKWLTDFDPINETDEQLETYGIPPRPDINNKEDYLSWVEIVDGVNFVPMTESEIMRGDESETSSNNTCYETAAYSAVNSGTNRNWSGYVSSLGSSSSRFYTQAQVDYVDSLTIGGTRRLSELI